MVGCIFASNSVRIDIVCPTGDFGGLYSTPRRIGIVYFIFSCIQHDSRVSRSVVENRSWVIIGS